MKKYYVIFTLAGKKICGHWEKAYTEAGAKLGAEFALICRSPNVQYDGCIVTAVRNL